MALCLCVVQDMKTGMSKGFGFIRMKNDEDYQTVLAEKNHVIEGVQVYVKPYTVDTKSSKSKSKDKLGTKSKEELGTPVDSDSFHNSSSSVSGPVHSEDSDGDRTTLAIGGKDSSV